MEQGLKQRLMGAFVIITLVVIFVPMFFEEKEPAQEELQVNIPNPPVNNSTVSLQEPTRPSIINPESEVNEETESNEALDITENNGNLLAQEESQTNVTEAEQQENGVNKPDVTQQDATDTVPAVSDTEKPALSSQGIPESWAVQVAAFKDDVNADKLVKKLQAAGYKAYAKTISSEQKLVRVFVGPLLTKDKALTIKNELDNAYKVKSMVVKFIP